MTERRPPPALEHSPAAAASKAWRRAAPLLIVGLLVLLIALGAWLLYERQERKVVESTQAELTRAAELKREELTAWEQQQVQDLTLLVAMPAVTQVLDDWLAGRPVPAAEVRSLRQLLGGLVTRATVESALLLDPSGNPRLAFGKPVVAGEPLAQLAAEASATGRPALAEFLLPGSPPTARVDLAVPVITGRGAQSRVNGVLVVRFDPYLQLFPLLSRWATERQSARVLLVDRNRLRALEFDPRPQAPQPVNLLRFEAPSETLGRALAAGAKAVIGADYRGVQVIAVALPVRNSPWVIELKIDRAEVLAPLRETALALTALSLLLVAAAGTLAAFWWRQERAWFLVERYAAELNREALARHFDYLARYGNDIVLLLDDRARIVEANDRASEAFRLSAQQLRERSFPDLAADPAFARALRERIEREESLRLESMARRGDGSLFHVEVSARRIEVEGRTFTQAILRDIGERKEWERKLQRSTNLYAALSQTNQAIVRLGDEQALYREICRVAVEYGRFLVAWVARIDEAQRELITEAHHGLEPAYFKRRRITLDGGFSQGQGLSATAVRENRVKISNDFQNDPRTLHWRTDARRLGIQSGAALPLRRGGLPIGVLTVYAGEAGYFGDDLVGLLQEMATDISFALDNLERERQRRAAEARLRESEGRYRQLVANMSSGVAVYAIEGDGARILFRDINQAVERIEKVEREQVVGRAIDEVFPGVREFGLYDLLLRVWRTGVPERLSATLYRDGRLQGWRENYVYRLEAGEVVAVYDDVTERVRAEQALAMSEERLRYALQGSSDGFWDYDMESGRIYFSDRYAEILGFHRQDLEPSTHTLNTLIHPDEIGRVWDELHQHVRGGSPAFVSEHRMLSKLGEWKWILVRGRVVTRDARGAATRMCGTHTDISERRRMEDQLRLWATVFESSNEGVFITDPERRILAVNRAFSRITGFGAEEALGRDPLALLGEGEDRRAQQEVWSTVEHSGSWSGEVRARRKDGELFAQWLAVSAARGEGGEVRHFIALFSDITERKAAEARIRYLAHHDLLTGLPNRVLMQDRLDQALAHARRTQVNVAVLVVDIDRFKHINDSLGHEMGDALLNAIAGRLRECVRDEDTVSRHGGDEFVLVRAEVKDAGEVAHTAQDIIQAVSRVYRIHDIEVHITPSVGISLFPMDGEDADNLLKNAEAAMYYAKERGRGNYQFFVGELNARTRYRLSLENRLRRALDRGELTLFYQPQVASNNGEVVGAEALIRWRLEGDGYISPAEFIPVAEESGLIVPIGAWVLNEACRQMQAWERTGDLKVPISVNISPAQFHHSGFRRDLGRILKACNLRPGQLEVELTEGMLMRGEEAERTLEELKAMGLMLAVDDFGTGYSSLSYLRRFPIDRLKVDQSFIRDMERDATDLAITESIITLGHNLGLRVVAEGVETEGAFNLLRELRCEDIQGFYFSAPMRAEQFAEWMRGRARA